MKTTIVCWFGDEVLLDKKATSDREQQNIITEALEETKKVLLEFIEEDIKQGYVTDKDLLDVFKMKEMLEQRKFFAALKMWNSVSDIKFSIEKKQEMIHD